MSKAALVIAVTGLVALGGCGSDGGDGTVSLLSFKAATGADQREILSTQGLTIQAGCKASGGQPILYVGASTNADDSWISAEFTEKHAPSGGYRFFMDDFDRDYGAWDFLGSGIDEATGALEYANPDGSHVTVNFIADQGGTQADCLFSGTAVSASE